MERRAVGGGYEEVETGVTIGANRTMRGIRRRDGSDRHPRRRMHEFTAHSQISLLKELPRCSE